MEKFSIWHILLIGGSLIIAILCSFIAQRKVHNQPLRERRKRLLIIFGIFFVVFFIISIIDHIQGGCLWHDLFTNVGFLVLLLLIVGEFLYAFFHKDKQPKTTNDKDV
jgi:hypothetical protein